MKDLLFRLKLNTSHTIQLEIEKSVFEKKLKEHVDEGSTGFFLSAFEGFSSSKNDYKGTVQYDGFKIRRRRKLFDLNLNLAIAKGSWRQKDHLLIIDTEINGFHGLFIPYYIFVPLFYLIFIIGTQFAESPSELWFIYPFILLHAALMLGIPYIIMRKSVTRMKYELERDFYFLTKKNEKTY